MCLWEIICFLLGLLIPLGCSFSVLYCSHLRTAHPSCTFYSWCNEIVVSNPEKNYYGSMLAKRFVHELPSWRIWQNMQSQLLTTSSLWLTDKVSVWFHLNNSDLVHLWRIGNPSGTLICEATKLLFLYCFNRKKKKMIAKAQNQNGDTPKHTGNI